MSDLLSQLERERQLEKIRGTKKRNPSEPMLRPLELAHYGRLHPIDDDPREWNYEPQKFPKRIRRRYVYALALISRSGSYVGSLTADRTGQFFLWKPGKFMAGAAGNTLISALERHLVPATFIKEELRRKIDKLEDQYRAEQSDRTVRYT